MEMVPALVCRVWQRGDRNAEEGLEAGSLAAVALIPGNFLVEKPCFTKISFSGAPGKPLSSCLLCQSGACSFSLQKLFQDKNFLLSISVVNEC